MSKSSTWICKKRQVVSIAVARNAKQLKLQDSSSPDSDDINESLVLPRVEPDTEEQQSESTVDEEVFNKDTAKECFEEWIRCQPKETIKMFSVALIDTLRRRFDLTDVASAQETGLLYGYNEKLFAGGVGTFTIAKVNSLTQFKESTVAHMFWTMKDAGKRHWPGCVTMHMTRRASPT